MSAIEFVKRVGIAAAAAVAVLTLAGFINSIMMAAQVRPAIAEVVAEERKARQAADERLADQINEAVKDRGLILAAISAHNPTDREAYIKIMRDRWTR